MIAISTWQIHDVGLNATETKYPNIYIVNGTLPNGEDQQYAARSLLESTNDTSSLVGQANDRASTFAIAAGRNYASFDKVQCKVDFIPNASSIVIDLFIAADPLKN